MYARTLKFLANLLFKRIFKGFLTSRKKREPNLWQLCTICGRGLHAFNKRQKICKKVDCRKVHRARQYRTGLERKRLEAGERAKQELFNQRFKATPKEEEE